MVRFGLLCFLLSFLCLINGLKGQYYTHHYIAPATWQYWSNANEFILANPDTVSATVELYKSDNTLLKKIEISPRSTSVFRPDESPLSLGRHLSQQVLKAAGLFVISNRPVSVNLRNVASDQLGTDAYIKGNASLTSFGDAGIGTVFRVGYYREDNGPSPLYSILALNDNTEVSLPDKRTITLRKGESYLFPAQQGAMVEASAPCVMNTGSFLDAPGGCGDGTFDQLPPLEVLGNRYFIVRTQGNSIDEQATIIAVRENTTVTVKRYSSTGQYISTDNYTLQKAGDFIRIQNGDGSKPYSVSEIEGNHNLLVLFGSAMGCEVDISTSFPVSSACNGSNYVATRRFTDYRKGTLPYFGYILMADSIAKVLFNGKDIESMTGKRIRLGDSGWFMLPFQNGNLGNPLDLTLESQARLNVAIIQIGGGFSMSATFSSFIAQPPIPAITNVTFNPCEGNFATLVADSTAEEVQWYFNGIEIPGATERTYLATSSGNYHITALQSCGERTSSAPVSVVLDELESPGTERKQTFCFDATISDLITTADSIRWYLHPDGGTPLPDTMRLVNGAFYFVSQIVNGCESVARSRTQVFIKKISSDLFVTACNAYFWNDRLYSQSGQFSKQLLTEEGCDSIARLNLTIFRDTVTFQSETVCDSYYWAVSGERLSRSGLYSARFKTITGCDSIYNLNLTIHPVYEKLEKKQVCDSLYWPVNQKTYYQHAQEEVIFSTQNGCDSTYVLDVEIYPSYKWKKEVVVCDSFFWEATGKNLTQSGDYIISEKTAYGCDSTYSLNLTVHASFRSDTVMEACDSLRWQVNDQTFTESGDIYLPMQTIHGCDSLYTLQLKINPSYQNEEVISACDRYFWPVSGQMVTSSGKYLYSGKTINQCDSVHLLDIQISPSFHDTIITEAVDEYFWEANNELVRDSGVFILSTKTINGCDSIHVLDLRLRKTNKYTWPNIISSNQDGANDHFTIYNIQNLVLIKELLIYDRWGNKMAVFHDLAPSIPALGWDGTCNGTPVVPGVYAFTAELEFKDKSREQIKGDITVLR